MPRLMRVVMYEVAKEGHDIALVGSFTMADCETYGRVVDADSDLISMIANKAARDEVIQMLVRAMGNCEEHEVKEGLWR